ncbi:hypothetical protein STCU_00383 [Strigomonas culicis]|uniref:Uncharacterized protein n=1 Tax=Strigomonas culicis TaxID=28005 RepID=S9WLH1_9TRYP|nr:hypothetical protein STCU_03848 [Strigomonas culicis]EPY36835.1 hypothetical protein STCU_00383 [Strigomonas culicis]|eukprot:EPY30855.1 hypothetical protein STCU_03848 [Strigomonas culicis]
MSLKFTHRDLAADDYKPVGSLFMNMMDRDTVVPRHHRNASARYRYDRSLAFTDLCLYPDTAVKNRSATPLRGRRCFTELDRHFTFDDKAPVETPRSGRAHGTLCPSDQLDMRLQLHEDAVVSARRKRYVPEPGRRAASADFSRYRGDDRTPTAASTPLRVQTPRKALEDHLGCGSLIPKEESPKVRMTPPPMEHKPRTAGLRIFPEKQLPSREAKHGGVKMVPPPAHWKSVTERQSEFLTFGVARTESPARRLYRNESSIQVADRATAAAASPRCDEAQRWRGRARSANPTHRGYDIITGRKLQY